MVPDEPLHDTTDWSSVMHEQLTAQRITDPAFVARFWEKVQKTEGCWLWTGSFTRGRSAGYGRAYLSAARKGAVHARAHRLAWAITHGDPGEMCVLHRCDNRLCVNPEHLFLGTVQDNNADRDSKGRGWDRSGERNVNARLSDADVLAIRRLRAKGKSLREIGERFGIADTTVSGIALKRAWKHVP